MESAVRKNIPVQASVKSVGWQNMPSRFISLDDTRIYIEMPECPAGKDLVFTPAESIDLQFKLNHFKHQAQTRIVGIETMETEDGFLKQVLCVCYPLHMQKIQRRKFTRVKVPAGQNPQANFIFGADSDSTENISIFSGKVFNISAGGFQADLPLKALEKFGMSDTFRVQMFFDKFEPPVFVDAQYRHCCVSPRNEHQATVGFQFVGLTHSQNGREAIRAIDTKIREYQKLNRYFEEENYSLRSA